MLLSARFLFIYEIILRAVDSTYILIALIPFLSKSVMGILLIKVRAAKKDGLGTLFKKASTPYTLWVYPVYMVIVFSGSLLLLPEALSGALALLLMTMVVLFIVVKESRQMVWGNNRGCIRRIRRGSGDCFMDDAVVVALFVTV